MDRAVFTAMTGARHATELLGVVSNNLANSVTPGYREQMAYFRTAPLEGEGAPTRAFAIGWTPYAKFQNGMLEATGSDRNAAIDGPGWFVAQRSDGSQAMTRGGAFTVENNRLTFADGRLVIGEAGPIQVPPGASISFTEDGRVLARAQNDPNQTTDLGRLKLVNPPTNSMRRGGDGLFELVKGRVEDLQSTATIKLRGRFLEASNVNPAQAMVSMISQTRLFDMNMKTIQTMNELDRAANSLLTRPR